MAEEQQVWLAGTPTPLWPTPYPGANSSSSGSNYSLDYEEQLVAELAIREQVRRLYLYCIPPMLFFCLATFIVNVVIVISVRWIRRPLSPTLSFSVSLALADAYASLVLGLGLIINSLLPVGLNVKLGPNEVCYVLTLEAFRLGGIIVTVGHLTALAINHYIGILRPLHYASTMTPRTTLVCIALLWLVPILAFFFYFSVVEGQAFRSKQCTNFHFLTHKQYRRIFSCFFFGPLIIMGIIYIHIFIIVRRHQANRLRSQNSQQLARSVKAIKTTVLILGTCLLGWIPAVVVYNAVCTDCILTFGSVDPITLTCINIMCNMLIILKTFVDPVIYAARMHEIKLALKRMRLQCCRCCPESVSGVNQMMLNSEMSQHRMSQYAAGARGVRRLSMASGTADTSILRFQSLRVNGSTRNHVVQVTLPLQGPTAVTNGHNNNGAHHRANSSTWHRHVHSTQHAKEHEAQNLNSTLI